jgi:hypothetical protein
MRETSDVQRAELFKRQHASYKWPIKCIYAAHENIIPLLRRFIHTIILFKEQLANLIEKNIPNVHIE